MIHDFICKRDSKSGKPLRNIEAYGWATGYKVAVIELVDLVGRLDRLQRERGMNVVFVCHSKIARRRNTDGPDWTAHAPALHDSAAGFLVGECDVVGYCTRHGDVTKDNADDRLGRGYSTGKRLCHVNHSATYTAKTRIPGLDTFELMQPHPWAPIADAIERHENTPDRSDVEALLRAHAARIGTDAVIKINAYLDRNPTINELQAALQRAQEAQ